MKVGKLVLISAASALISVSAFAQATRTWVSGVGDDVNPCSRTAPCKTWAGAISKTATGGIIDALDPGGFGAVTITKAMTLEGNGTLASTLSSATNGIIVNITSGTNRDVVIRNVLIDGAGVTLGINGIRFLAGDSLTVEDCYLKDFSSNGIDFEPGNNAKLNVHRTSILLAAGNGILSKPSGGASAKVWVDSCLLAQNGTGFRAEDGTGAEVSHAVISNNSANGVTAISNAGGNAIVLLSFSQVFNNAAIGLAATNAQAQIASWYSDITANGTGMQSTGSGVLSSGLHNHVAFNGAAGSPFTGGGVPES